MAMLNIHRKCPLAFEKLQNNLPGQQSAGKLGETVGTINQGERRIGVTAEERMFRKEVDILVFKVEVKDFLILVVTEMFRVFGRYSSYCSTNQVYNNLKQKKNQLIKGQSKNKKVKATNYYVCYCNTITICINFVIFFYNLTQNIFVDGKHKNIGTSYQKCVFTLHFSILMVIMTI